MFTSEANSVVSEVNNIRSWLQSSQFQCSPHHHPTKKKKPYKGNSFLYSTRSPITLRFNFLNGVCIACKVYMMVVLPGISGCLMCERYQRKFALDRVKQAKKTIQNYCHKRERVHSTPLKQQARGFEEMG